MPRLLIHKDGENPTIESPDMSAEHCESQRAFVAAHISVAHGGPVDTEGGNRDRDSAIELGWVSIAAHAVTAVEVVEAPQPSEPFQAEAALPPTSEGVL